MSNGLISKFKNWMTEEDEYYDDEEMDTDLEENEEEEGYVIKDEYDEHLIYGEDVNSLVYQIKELNQNSKTVAVVGQGTFTRFYRKNKIITIKNSGHMGVLYDYYMKYSSSSHKYKIVAYAQKD